MDFKGIWAAYDVLVLMSSLGATTGLSIVLIIGIIIVIAKQDKKILNIVLMLAVNLISIIPGLKSIIKGKHQVQNQH